MQIYVLSVDITYEHGSNHDTGRYNHHVTIPAADITDAFSVASDFVERYHAYYKHLGDYALSASLSLQKPLFASRYELTEFFTWSARSEVDLTHKAVETPTKKTHEATFTTILTLAELRESLKT